MYMVDQTRLFFTTSDALELGRYEKENVGLNHIAFGVRSIAELDAAQVRLDKSGVIHSGKKLDHYGRKEFLWFDDPDGIRVEFYVRSELK
jgi:glyoxylase I family protein